MFTDDVSVHDCKLLAELAAQARANAGVKGTGREWIVLYGNFEKAAIELANYISAMEIPIEPEVPA